MDLNAYPKLWQHQHQIMEADSVEETFLGTVTSNKDKAWSVNIRLQRKKSLFEMIMVLSSHGRNLCSLQAHEFNHIITSPRFPQSNGQVEWTIQTVKRLLKGSKDSYLALMSYRATLLPMV